MTTAKYSNPPTYRLTFKTKQQLLLEHPSVLNVIPTGDRLVKLVRSDWKAEDFVAFCKGNGVTQVEGLKDGRWELL